MTTVLPSELAAVLPCGQQIDSAQNGNISAAASQISSGKLHFKNGCFCPSAQWWAVSLSVLSHLIQWEVRAYRQDVDKFEKAAKAGKSSLL